MPYCPNCGARCGEEMVFCNNCGSRIQLPTIPEEPPLQTLEPLQEPAGKFEYQQQPQDSYQQSQNSYQQPQNSNQQYQNPYSQSQNQYQQPQNQYQQSQNSYQQPQNPYQQSQNQYQQYQNPYSQSQNSYQQPQNSWQQYRNPYQPQPEVPRVSTSGMMAWAIITLLLCTIPGIIAIVNVAGVNKSATVEEQNRKLSNAKICCIVGTVLGVLELLGTLSLF